MNKSTKITTQLLLIFTIVLSAFNVPAATHATILQYHHVATGTPSVTSISPQKFTQHLNWLEENGFTVVDLPIIIDKLRNGGTLVDKTVAITFDDGYKNILNEAVPELQKRKMPFTVFVNPGLIALKSPLYMSWDDIKTIAAKGATIANHGWKHDYWVRQPDDLTEKQWHERVKLQIIDTEIAIEQYTGQKHKLVAYPYGEYNLWLTKWLKEEGFVAFGQHSGAVGPSTNWQTVPRFPANGVYANLKTLKTKLLSLPFPIKTIQPIEPTLDKYNPPELFITLGDMTDLVKAQLACFVAGQQQPIVEWVTDNSFKVIAQAPLGKGRSRYNCTAPSRSQPGRYYWFSQYWLNLSVD